MNPFDYVIVGGGSAGSVLAGRLSEDPNVRVALLEAGGPDASVLIHCPAGLAVMAQTGQANWALTTTPQAGLNGRRGYQPRGKVLGGSSSINAMIYARGHRADYDHWAALGNPGWSFDEVLTYFKKSEHNSRGTDPFHGDSGPLAVSDLRSPNPFTERFVQAAVQAGFARNEDFHGPSQEGVGIYQVTHRNGERWSAAKGYLSPHSHRANLQIITHAQVSRILFEGRRAMGVEYLHQGHLHTCMAHREVLLSAGAIHSPQILMRSGVGDGAHLQQVGIALAHHLPGVGMHLHDHPDVVQVYDAPQATDLLGVSLPGMVNAVKGIFEWRSRRTGMLTTNFAEGGGFIKSAPEQDIPDLQLHFVVGKLIDHGRKPVWGHGFSCHVCVLRPQSRGSVRLASPRIEDAPLIDPAFLSDPDDVRKLVLGFKHMRRILQAPALASAMGRELSSASAQSDAQIEQYIRDHADTIYHPVGSCRMGTGATDVVDAQLRVHGIQHLRVVDASIMPRIVGGNTNAPTIMIAEKAVDMIRQAHCGH